MFGSIFNAVGDAASSVVDTVADTATDLINDPIGKTVDMTVVAATQSIQDGLTIIDGLTEGEIREKAILRLGADVVSGMATSELIEWYQNE